MRKTSVYLDDELMRGFLPSAMKPGAFFSFDERHFRLLAPLQGGSFSLLPADF